MSLVAVVFFCTGDKAIFQGQYNIVFCLIYLVYLIEFKPFEDNFIYKQELFTETCFILFGYGLLLFNQLVPSGETRSDIGWYNISVLSTNLGVNLVIVAVSLSVDLKNTAKKVKLWC